MNKERTESNEELVSIIQAGEREMLPVLWSQVERFVRQQAGKRARLLHGAGGVTEEDLYQSGYLALIAAVGTFDPTKGMSFIGWMVSHLKTAFNEAAGYRSEKQRHDPIHSATSLDLPLGDDEGGVLEDMVGDPDSAQGFEEAENRLWREKLHVALEQALDTLPEGERNALDRRYFQGMTLEEAGADMGVTASEVRKQEGAGLRSLRHPRISRELRVFIEERTPYYSGVGLSTFEHTGSSQPERLVILREEWGNGSSLVKT